MAYMHEHAETAPLLIHSRGFYRIYYHHGAAGRSAAFMQLIDEELLTAKLDQQAESYFCRIPAELNAISISEKKHGIVSRRVTLQNCMPLADMLAQDKSIDASKDAVSALVAFLAELEDRKNFNTNLTPYNLLYYPAEKKLRYIQLSCNLPKGDISSPYYRAPELLGLIKHNHSIQADFYSAAMILYQHFSGSHPFEGMSRKKAAREQIVRSLAPLHRISPGFPKQLSLVIKKMLSKQPRQRYSTVYGISKDITDFYAGLLPAADTFVPGMFDFNNNQYVSFPASYVDNRYKQLDSHIFEGSHRSHKVIYLAGSQLNASDKLTREYFSKVSRKGIFVATAHIKENAKYLPFYASALIFKEIASWLKHSKIYKDPRFIQFSQNTDSIIIETLVHICPELTLLRPPGWTAIENPITDTNILYTAVKLLFRFIGRITKPIIINVNNTEYIDKDSTKLFFELLSTADIPHIVFVFQSFNSAKQPRQMRNRNAKYSIVDLRAMDEAHISEMLSQYANGMLREPAGLAAILKERCLGKYELVCNHISEMRKNGSLSYSRQECAWLWQAGGACSIASPLSLEEISEAKQKLLSRTSLQLLQQASLIGNVFNLNLLSKLTGFTKEQIFIRLADARKLNLVFELTQYSNFKSPENSIFFKFTSDRAYRVFYRQGRHNYAGKQSAAFALTARYLIEKGNNKLLFEDFFASIPRFAESMDIAEKACVIQVMISKIEDYIFLCKFSKAENLLQVCFGLLPENAWLEKYYLTKKLYYTAIKLSYNTDTFEQTDKLYAEANTYLATPEDHIDFNFLYIKSRLRRNEPSQALRILKYSAMLSHPVLLAKQSIAGKLASRFFYLMFRYKVLNKEMLWSNAGRQETGIKVLANINVLASKLDEAIYKASMDAIVSEVFASGISAPLAEPMLVYAKRLLDKRKHIRFALELAQFVIENFEDNTAYADRCRLYYYTNIHPFCERIQSSKQRIKCAIDQKVSLGDLTTAYDLSFDYIFRALVEGEKLQNLLNETQKIWRIKRKYSKKQLDFDLLTVFYDRIKALYDHQRITDVTANSEKFERHPKLSFWNNLTLLIYFYNTNQYDKALICAGNAQLRAGSIENNLPIIMLEFYYCLSLAEDCSNMSSYRRTDAIKYIKLRHREIHELSLRNSENFQHMALLLKGLYIRLSKSPAKAIPTIKRAAFFAEKYSNINIQAICYKTLAQVAAEQKKDKQYKLYIVKAYNYYKKWGANTIAERIKFDNFIVFEEMNLRIFNDI
jgi:serine/threonine protein kinase